MISILKSVLVFAIAAPVFSVLAHGASRREVDFKLLSPDRRIEVKIWVGETLHYAIAVDGQGVMANSRLGLKLKVGVDDSWQCLQTRRPTVDTSWENRFGKRRQVRDHYNELRLMVRQGLMRMTEVVFRAYDDGVAFCYVLPVQEGLDSPVLAEEQTEFAFAGDYPCYAGEDAKKGFASPQEWIFQKRQLKEITPASLIGLPLLVQTPVAWVAITESNLQNWPGLWLAGGSGPSRYDPAPVAVLNAKSAPRLDGNGLAKLTLPCTSPWRVIMIGREPGRLIESDLISNLAAPCQLADPSWVKPGMMAWDHWWSGGVQMDTAT
ncbi:MAG: putative alpha-glucosidase, partial [Verrucomicrobia bacterium]|nr:putative alpha-glucosidase [Verrucomicrobiota bacterium]